MFDILFILIIFSIVLCISKLRLGDTKATHPSIITRGAKLVLHLPELNEGETKASPTYFTFLFRDQQNKYDTIHVFSPFADCPKREEKLSKDLYVQFSGEAYNHDVSAFDLNLIAQPTDPQSKTIAHLFATFHSFALNDFQSLTQVRRKAPKKRFCCFIVSNGNAPVRNAFFEELNAYKKVDSCGNFLNNTDLIAPERDTPEYFRFLSQFKFCICFENKQQDWYLTEKLPNAYRGNTIPIYYGCPQAISLLNGDAFFYIHSRQDFEKVVENIKILDNDDALYDSMFFQPLARRLPAALDLNMIRHQINTILSS